MKKDKLKTIVNDLTNSAYDLELWSHDYNEDLNKVVKELFDIIDFLIIIEELQNLYNILENKKKIEKQLKKENEKGE